MSEIPHLDHNSEPQVTPDTLHDVALLAWQNNPDAIRNDGLPYGGDSLRMYPTDNPRDSIAIFPVMGHKTMEEGTFRMLRTKGSKTIALLDVITNHDGERTISSLRPSDLPHAMERVVPGQEMLEGMQKAISESTTTKPMGKVAKIIGRSATQKSK